MRRLFPFGKLYSIRIILGPDLSTLFSLRTAHIFELLEADAFSHIPVSEVSKMCISKANRKIERLHVALSPRVKVFQTRPE